MATNQNFLPKSIRFRYEHRSKLKLQGTKEFEDLRSSAKMIIKEAQTKLRLIIRDTQDLEERTNQEDIKNTQSLMD